MRAVDLIDKKKNGLALSPEELRALMNGYLDGSIPDYQMSAFLMAVVWHGMTDEELGIFTKLMSESGDTLNLDAIPGIKVDKHSTGGVGDKTTLILGPMLAAIGVPVAKMSGRGLGHTGGTIDKLESIPGFQTALSTTQFVEQVKRIGIAIAGQTGDLAPADKRIYSLRDVTATVESLPLIASSIMSKKLASGANAIVLDVKVGSGAFMKSLADAKRLAATMVRIGREAGRNTVAILSNMEEPLGRAIGNALEVKEAIATLRGEGPSDLTEICLTLGAQMAVLSGIAEDAKAGRECLRQAIADGRALVKMRELVEAQGGDASVIDHPEQLPMAPCVRTLHATGSGYLGPLPALAFGEAAMRLGAGRATKEDAIDPSVGLVLDAKTGDYVEAGQALLTVHAASEADAVRCLEELASVFELRQEFVPVPELVLGRVGADEANADDDTLLAAAHEARELAYVPYSQFAVGAAVMLRDGRIIQGANIENAAYGLTNCAERNALFSAVLGRRPGERVQDVGIAKIAVVADSPDPVPPCGACRQVMAELCSPDTPVFLANLNGDLRHTTVRELLPGAFTPDQLAYARTDT